MMPDLENKSEQDSLVSRLEKLNKEYNLDADRGGPGGI